MARSSVTAKQILYDAKALLGNRDSLKPNDAEGIRFLNYSLFTLSNLLDGLYALWEMTTQTVTRTRDVTSTTFHGSGSGYGYANKSVLFAAAHNITMPGSLVVMYDSSADKGYLGVVDSILSSQILILVSDPVGADIASPNLTVCAMANPWYWDGGNVDSLNVKRVLQVRDATNGHHVWVNLHEFEDADNDPNLANSVAALDFAGAIHLRAGSGITSIGTVTLYYAADPAAITALTDSVDIETEHHSALVQDVARQIEKAYPDGGRRPDQGDPFGELRQLYDSIEMNLAKKRVGVKTNG